MCVCMFHLAFILGYYYHLSYVYSKFCYIFRSKQESSVVFINKNYTCKRLLKIDEASGSLQEKHQTKLSLQTHAYNISNWSKFHQMKLYNWLVLLYSTTWLVLHISDTGDKYDTNIAHFIKKAILLLLQDM